jgi:hypothetical protein
MKSVSLIASLFTLLFLLGACNSGSVLTNSTGAPNEVIVVMPTAQWNGSAGEALKDALNKSVPGLPQPESQLTVSYTDPANFDGFLKVVRNILMVEIDHTMYTKTTMTQSFNLWARNQAILKIKSPDEASFDLFVAQREAEITDFFIAQERSRKQELLKKNYNLSVQNQIKDQFGIDISIPEDMKNARDTTDFFWVTNDAKKGRQDLIVYSFPYTDQNTFTKEYLIAKRDSVLKANLPGVFPNSYMTTEMRYDPIYTPLEINGKYVGELRGLWKMVGDMMGGPFVSHARVDTKNQRVIVTEGFVFAPETKKRNHVRSLEAILYSTALPGDKPEVKVEEIVLDDEK